MTKERESQGLNTCYHCGKVIKFKMVHVVPSLLAIRFGDFQKAFHPACYVKVEEEASRELAGLRA